MSQPTISDIKAGRTWKSVPWPQPFTPRKDDWLPVETVREIKRRIAAGDKLKDIAAAFGVSPAVVSGIKTGVKYKDIA